MTNKRRTRKEIEQEILKYLAESDFPGTTEMVAKACRLNWYAASENLFRLKSKGIVVTKKVGKQNQWLLQERYQHGFKKKEPEDKPML